MKKYLKYLLSIVLIGLVGVGIWAFMVYCEGEDPEIILNRDIKMIGQETAFDITCIDRKSGLRNVSVDISQDGKKYTLNSLNLPQKGVNKETLTVNVFPEELKLHDGTATVGISATDYSLRKNTTVRAFEVVIDTIPPSISPAGFSNYINPGGSCVVTYSLSKDVSRSGVQVDDDFFPSYPETTSDGIRHISYFAIPINASKKNLKICILAEDNAGNSSLCPVSFHIRNKKFRRDRMNISQRFLEMKMPEFRRRYKDLREITLLKAFSRINTEMRAHNLTSIETICKDTQQEQLWKGTFLRMKNAATMATFGDRRTYYHDGREISKSVHMGVDLASTRNAPVEASNRGIVVFTEYLGIYGNTIIIDHGMGIFSLYGHLSSIGIEKGQTVRKGAMIGRTGNTGMAGGDHLHFSMIVGRKFVNPVEWWDSHWIKDNITRKLSPSQAK
ncbi:MAG: M23 family metallopeptidase [Thermodesulfobacteriota bacterium]|nr:M23 family metallopeptidase [Thermodesulfobacteriota bacterium]